MRYADDKMIIVDDFALSIMSLEFYTFRFRYHDVTALSLWTQSVSNVLSNSNKVDSTRVITQVYKTKLTKEVMAVNKLISFFKSVDVSLPVFSLTILFGLGSWLTINGVWVELPTIVPFVPEQWKLSSYLSLIGQLSNIDVATIWL